MQMKKHVFLSLVLRPKYEKEFHLWKAAIQQHFDISIICESRDVTRLVAEFLQNKLKLEGLDEKARLIEFDASTPMATLEPLPEPRDSRSHIYVTCCEPPKGSGTINFKLPRLEELLPSATSMVRILLELTSLDRFLDAFDGKRMTQLKTILDRHGVDEFFDAVIQVAFQVGFRADETGVDLYMERMLASPPRSRSKAPTNLENNTTSLEKLFEQLIELPEPHDVLKAALAHYVSVHRRVSQTEASKMLKVSRSTFQAHLSLAERLKIADYFTSWGSHA